MMHRNDTAATDDELTARATQAIIDALRGAGARPSGLTESGNLPAAFTFTVRYQGEDFHVEVAKERLTD